MDNGIKTGPDSLVTLKKECELWSTHNNVDSISLLQAVLADNGQVSLQFSLGKEHHFTLCCPLGYPQHKDSFYIEANAEVSSWCAAVNEYLLEGTAVLSLEKVLNKAHSLYILESRLWQHSPESSGDEGIPEEEEGSTEEPLADRAWEVMAKESEELEQALAAKKRRWQQKEAVVRSQLKQPKMADMFADNLQPELGHMFSCSGASGILTNDLVDLMISEGRTGIRVEPVDDNIFLWAVYISNFKPQSPLWHDLKEVKELCGYEYVELQVEFAMDLYPCFPPFVRLIRPLIKGHLMEEVANLETLRPSCWHPACSMKVALEEVKELLQDTARIDVGCERNSPSAFSSGAYLPIESSLAKLAWVSEQISQYKMKALSPVKRAMTVSLTSKSVETAVVENPEAWGLEEPGSQGLFKGKSAVLSECTAKFQEFLKGAEEHLSIAGNHEKSLGSFLARLRGCNSKDGTEDEDGTSSAIGKWKNELYYAAEKEKDKQTEVALEQIFKELQNFNSQNSTRSGKMCLDPSFPFGLDDSALSHSNAASTVTLLSNATTCSDSDYGPSESTSSSREVNLPEPTIRQPNALTPVIVDSKISNLLGETLGILERNCNKDIAVRLLESVETSVLLPFIQSKLVGISFSQICQVHKVFTLILDILEEMAQQSQLVLLLVHSASQSQTIYNLLCILNNQSQKKSTNGSVPKPLDAGSNHGTSSENSHQPSSSINHATYKDHEARISKRISSLCETLSETVQRHNVLTTNGDVVC